MTQSSKSPFYWLFDLSLVILILIGGVFRFSWVGWNEGTNLHPDEYGLTGTLTQLSIPETAADYFNTRISPISPYQKYDEFGQPTRNGPDNRMRWGQFPIIFIRWMGEATGNTGYDEIRLLGRTLSALADSLSVLLILVIGWRLYERRVGLLAAALSGLAVMQIQQSHFMTVDNFGSFFTTLALYACVEIAKHPPLRRDENGVYSPGYRAWGWYALFGLAFGLALACKVNLLPVGGLLLVAVFIAVADLKLRRPAELGVIFGQAVLAGMLALLVAGLAFRVAQPMTFRAEEGDTGFFTLNPNPDWVESMKVASGESSGIGGGPPGEQWAHRPMIIFPLVNMVLWGMGLPLGISAWLGWGVAFWQTLRWRNWQAHLLPLVWTGGYFLFMGTRWVKSIRYFLPIYPFLALLAAWLLLEVWRRSSGPIRRAVADGVLAFVLFFTLAWATAFTQAVYATPHTRIQAARWMFQNIPGPVHLTLLGENGEVFREPVSIPDDWLVSNSGGYAHSFVLPASGLLTEVLLPSLDVDSAASLHLVIASDPDGQNVLAEITLPVTAGQQRVAGRLNGVKLEGGQTYYLHLSTPDSESIFIRHVTIANENWDEGLPMPLDGRDPFGGLYRGLTMEVRWFDDENKRQMYFNILAQTDYIILPSQRGIWSTCRIPRMYPMTMEYYRALFDGRLGFEQVAIFSAPFKLGPLQISDVGGTVAWNQTPRLPLFNSSQFAAEEAFSIYDHPPVWIFKKTERFDIERAMAILNAVDLTQAVAQQPPDADGDWCPEQ